MITVKEHKYSTGNLPKTGVGAVSFDIYYQHRTFWRSARILDLDQSLGCLPAKSLINRQEWRNSLDHPFYLAMVIAVLCSFGCVLGFVSFEETRNRRKAMKKIASSNPEKASGEAVFSK